MERTAERRVRALRGSAAAAIAVLFASTAHTLAGGIAPPAWLVVSVTILAAPLCVALVGRRRSVVRLSAAVITAQVALHTAFAAIGSAAPAAMPAGHHHLLLPLVASVDPAAATMSAGHALAAVATIVTLGWGERMLAAIARGIRRLLTLAPQSAPHPHAAPASFSAPPRAVAAVSGHSVSRRGPPARFAPSFAG